MLEKTLEKANEYAEAGGFITRIVEKDGNAFVLTMDVKTNRLNFRIKTIKLLMYLVVNKNFLIFTLQ